MKNIQLHLRKADYQMRMALSWLHQTGDPLSLKVGHAIATLREVRVALKEAAAFKRWWQETYGGFDEEESKMWLLPAANAWDAAVQWAIEQITDSVRAAKADG